MTYTIEVLPTAEEQLAKLPKDAQRQITKKIDALRENPRPPGVKLLHTKERLYRLRVGDYQVIDSIEGRHLVVLIIRIAQRSDVYQNLESLSRQVLIWRRKKG